MPLSLRLALFSLAPLLVACAPKTGLLLVVQGPSGETSVAASVSSLEVVLAHGSYCERWVTDASTPNLTFSVAGRDLARSPLEILVVPDLRTNLGDPVEAIVLAHDASHQLVGYAAFGAHAFVKEKVLQYSAWIGLLGPGADPAGPRYVADDGCVCLPGQPHLGNSSGAGCDQLIPPSFARLVDTTGCDLPPGSDLPLGVCDGQLYPGEHQNRDVPCFATVAGGCRIGRRVCNDTSGRGVDRECRPDSTAPALATSTLCDDFLTCEQTACGDAVTCLRDRVPAHKKLRCSLPVAPTAVAGAAAPCAGGSWSVTLGAQTGADCVSAMLDGTQLDVLTVGLATAGMTTAQLTSASCPPTLFVEKIDTMKPATLLATVAFSMSVGETIYDVTLVPIIGCLDPLAISLACEEKQP